MKQIKRIILVGLMCALATSLWAQEQLVGLGENPRVPKQVPQTKSKLLKATPLALPFVDDFARATNHLPDADNWEDNYVFINNSYAINPPTIGVATFDAFDNNGKLYPSAGPITFAADTLTSKTINLNYIPSDSVYLSFFFQPAGYGDMPEPDDTLTLQFYTSNNTWVNVWSASVNVKTSTVVTRWGGKTDTITTAAGDLGTVFYRTQLKIDNPSYLHAAFKFRFINYATIAVHRNAPGRSTSSDHWHLDYVYLDKNRSSSNLNLPDIGVSLPQKPLSPLFESIPAIHLSSQDAINELFPDPTPLQLDYRNLGWGTKSVTRNFRITALYGSGSTVQYSGGSENIFDNQTIEFNYQAPKYNFTTTDDSAAFVIQSYLVTDNDIDAFRTALRYNDTTSYLQYFGNYYAYDDGTAENGYGLFGNGTANGRVAVKYQSYKTDSIRGVYMYFNRTINNANAVSFYITVWSDNNGVPGSILHTEKVTAPVFKDSLNKFVAYKFSKAIEVLKGVPYYVGWTQTMDMFLDIGFDRNRNHQDKNFFNIGNTWETSVFEGSLMLRPIFTRVAADFPDDHVEPLPPTPTNVTAKEPFIVYPNPVKNGTITVAENDGALIDVQRIEIYNIMGVLMLSAQSSIGSINVSTLPTGMYIMRVWENGALKGSKRFVVTK